MMIQTDMITGGDMVTIVEQHDDGWTTCQYQSKTGFVPSSYYTVIETPDSTDTKTTLEDLPSVSSSMSGARSGNNDSSSNSSSSSNVAVNFPPTPSVSIVKTSSSANLSASSKKKKEPRTDKKKLVCNSWMSVTLSCVNNIPLNAIEIQYYGSEHNLEETIEVVFDQITSETVLQI